MLSLCLMFTFSFSSFASINTDTINSDISLKLDDTSDSLPLERVETVSIQGKNFEVGIYGNGSLGVLLGKVDENDLELGEQAVLKALNPSIDLETAPSYVSSIISRVVKSIDVTSLNRWYNHRLIDDTTYGGKARCMNYAYFYSGNIKSPGGIAELEADTSVSYTGSTSQLKSLQLSYNALVHVKGNSSKVTFGFSGSSPSLQIENHTTYDTINITATTPVYSANWQTSSPVYTLTSPDLTVSYSDVHGGTITEATSTVTGNIELTNGSHSPTARVSFTTLCYSGI